MTTPVDLTVALDRLADMLHTGHHALALSTADGRTLTFDGRGVSDLLRLLTAEPQALRGALVADKVVGKAAAALMALGQVRAVRADVMSQGAWQLLTAPLPPDSAATRPDHVSYTTLADHIINRTQTDWCPMERACHDAPTPDECLLRIRAKLCEMHAGTHNPTNTTTNQHT